jgi:hypothetical protein
MHDNKGKIQIDHFAGPFDRDLPQQAEEHPGLRDKVQGGQEREA